jgi:hypothetical protein
LSHSFDLPIFKRGNQIETGHSKANVLVRRTEAVAGVLQAKGNTGGGVNPNNVPPSLTVVAGAVTLSNTASFCRTSSFPETADESTQDCP